MTAIDIVIKRTNMSESDAAFYVSMAEMKVRQYLDLDDTASLERYTFSIADIAVLYYQYDESSKNAGHSLGFSSHSFTEGSVSESVSMMTGAEVSSVYIAQIDDVLSQISQDRMVYFI